jgi:hypothetical protein
MLPARAFLTAVISVLVGSTAIAAQVNFESRAVGTTYGAGANTPGDPIFQEGGIHVSIENFFHHDGPDPDPNPDPDFNFAVIRPGGTDLFSTRHVSLNNISLGFDLSQLGFAVDEVTIEYQQFGGFDNFLVNSGPLHIIDLPSLPSNVAPGVTATVDNDSIHLSGSISRLVVGGQELALDNITAVPEPSGLILLGVGAACLSAVRGRRRRCS